ncbi:Proteasome subunit beta type-2 [Eumeta japonica]|uniref:Proteasome subunit beta type-2 n=1 Tax=Eumeta variegata TaxID=151549 RepID=A0A4C1VXZ2_EUMVA|nr:Proteasome subunit beta type-2 [Eumeta japonica]
MRRRALDNRFDDRHSQMSPPTKTTKYVSVYQDKIYTINDHLIMGVIGDHGDSVQLTQYIIKNVQLYRMKNGYELNTDAIVHFTRNSLADTAKNKTPYAVGVLFGGYDKAKGPRLFYMDYLATCVAVPFMVHGIGGILSLGVIQSLYSPKREAYALMMACVTEVQARFIVNLQKFQVAVVDSHGVRYLDSIVASKLKA